MDLAFIIGSSKVSSSHARKSCSTFEAAFGAVLSRLSKTAFNLAMAAAVSVGIVILAGICGLAVNLDLY